MLKTIYRTHKERVQTTRSQPELPLFKLIKCARDLWPFGNREDAASRKSRRRCLEDSTARKQQLFWSVQSSPVQSSPQSSLVQSPGFTETHKLVMELRVQYSLVRMNGEIQLYIMQQMRSNLYKWRAEHNAKFICFAELVQMRGAGIQYNMWSLAVIISMHVIQKPAYFVKLWCTALKIYSSNFLLPLRVHTITSKGSFLINAHLVWSQTM